MKEFSRVVGYEDIKIELYRIVDMMINPDKYKKLGVKTTRGLLLVGNPGLGKTLMANCMIDASKRKSYVIKRELPTNEFMTLIKDTFREAKDNAPSIVLLDDIDKFGKDTRSEEYSTVQACIDSCNDSEVFFLASANNSSLAYSRAQSCKSPATLAFVSSTPKRLAKKTAVSETPNECSYRLGFRRFFNISFML